MTSVWSLTGCQVAHFSTLVVLKMSSTIPFSGPCTSSAWSERLAAFLKRLDSYCLSATLSPSFPSQVSNCYYLVFRLRLARAAVQCFVAVLVIRMLSLPGFRRSWSNDHGNQQAYIYIDTLFTSRLYIQ
jgi:hypothetical protein